METYDFDLYEALDLGPDAHEAEIKKAYRRLALLHHPDRTGGNETESATARVETTSTSTRRYCNRASRTSGNESHERCHCNAPGVTPRMHQPHERQQSRTVTTRAPMHQPHGW